MTVLLILIKFRLEIWKIWSFLSDIFDRIIFLPSAKQLLVNFHRYYSFWKKAILNKHMDEFTFITFFSRNYDFRNRNYLVACGTFLPASQICHFNNVDGASDYTATKMKLAQVFIFYSLAVGFHSSLC